jgi:excisionase family DNA binding protein
LEQDELLTVEDVARILGVSTKTVYRMLDDGELKGIRVGRLWRVSQEDLDDYLHGDPVKRANEYVLNVLGITPRDVQKGAEWPVYECPACDVDALVDTGEMGGEAPAVRWRCFACHAEYRDNELKECSRCGRLRPRKELTDSDACSYCWQEMLEKG